MPKYPFNSYLLRFRRYMLGSCLFRTGITKSQKVQLDRVTCALVVVQSKDRSHTSYAGDTTIKGRVD